MKITYTIILILIIFIFFFYRKNEIIKSKNMIQIQIQNIEASDFLNIVKQNSDLVVLDVRMKEEYEAGHLENSININWQDQKLFKSEIEKLDKSKAYALYCRSGARSSQAAKFMTENGFTYIYNVLEGVNSGSLPLVK